MHCVVTAGPTFEPLDEVRRLTNFSTGRLGSELAAHLTARGHRVTLLLGQQATWRDPQLTRGVQFFTTTADLREKLQALSSKRVDAVFHAAAVSDFSFGKIWVRSEKGELTEVKAGKISTRQGTLLAELNPTGKIIAELRGWFPSATLVGWKFEVDGGKAGALAAAAKQLAECRLDACVANGPAYGLGFCIVCGSGEAERKHARDSAALFAGLEQLLGNKRAGPLKS